MRYVVPLREGGSLPAVVDTERGPFVVKFLGSGHGAKALIAELIAARIAERLELPIPAPAVVLLEEGFGAAEPDPEIQDLLRGSGGPNFGLAFLSGALGYDPAADGALIDPTLAASIVWFDAYLTNPDRSPRNTNILVWDGRAMADRPRLGAVRPSSLGGLAGAHPVALPADPRSCPAAHRRRPARSRCPAATQAVG